MTNPALDGLSSYTTPGDTTVGGRPRGWRPRRACGTQPISALSVRSPRKHTKVDLLKGHWGGEAGKLARERIYCDCPRHQFITRILAVAGTGVKAGGSRVSELALRVVKPRLRASAAIEEISGQTEAAARLRRRRVLDGHAFGNRRECAQ